MRHYPLFWPLMAFLIGIVSAGFVQYSFAIALVFAVLCVAFCAIYGIRINKWSVPLVLVFFFALGQTITIWQNHRFQKQHFTNFSTKKAVYVAQLATAPTATKNALRLELRLKKKQSQNPENIVGRIFLYVPKNSACSKLLPGDYLLFKATLNPIQKPQNPYEFDYQNYLHLHQIYAQAYTTEVHILNQNDWSPTRLFAQLRGKLLKHIKALKLSPEEEAVSSALLLGYRHLITDETQQAFASAGAMHVLAVSGLHVGILYLITAFLLRLDMKKRHRNKWYKVLLTLAIIWCYAFLTGLSPSVSRAAVMFSFIALGRLGKRKPPTFQAIIISAFVLLIYQPNYIFEVGFQLSYAAVFGILYLQPRIEKWLPKPKFKWLTYLWGITTVSLAAQAATFAFGLYYFHQFPVYFIFSNLVVIPAAWLLMVYGIFILLISLFTIPPAILLWPFKALLKAMLFSVHFVETLPFSIVQHISISRWELALLLSLVILSVPVFSLRKKKALFLFMGISTLLLYHQNIEAWEQIMQRKMTIYSVKKSAVVEITVGRSSLFIAPKTLLDDEESMLFHVRHNQWAQGVNPIECSWQTDTTTFFATKKGSIIDVKNNRILSLQHAKDTALLALNPDYVLVDPRIYPPATRPKSAQFILTNGHSAKSVNAWKKIEPTVYVLQEEGAFEVELLR